MQPRVTSSSFKQLQAMGDLGRLSEFQKALLIQRDFGVNRRIEMGETRQSRQEPQEAQPSTAKRRACFEDGKLFLAASI
jgi:hypothetical protein